MNLYNRIQGRNVDRLAALSDGIFAVAMTLLVLDLHLPTAAEIHGEGELLAALCALGPQWITYGMSFLTLGIFSLVINAGFIMLVAWFVPDFHIAGLWKIIPRVYLFP